jgi:hypothetical protein
VCEGDRERASARGKGEREEGGTSSYANTCEMLKVMTFTTTTTTTIDMSAIRSRFVDEIYSLSLKKLSLEHPCDKAPA